MTTTRKLSALAVLLWLGAGQAVAELRLNIEGLVADTGHVLLVLHDDPAAYAERTAGVLNVRAAVRGDTAAFVFPGLAPGRYAVSVFQDLNGNDSLDTNLIGRPTEPYGFSRNARGGMGAPSFEQSALDYRGEPLAASITLHRPGRN